MDLRSLGSTGLRVAPIAFGAGPISQLLVDGERKAQQATIARAVELGIDWFDTAATYGAGASEESLGEALTVLGFKDQVRIATKVRIQPEQVAHLNDAVRESLVASLRRLRIERVTLLQIHNAITATAGAQPTSLTPSHVLAPGGLLEAMEQLRTEGVVEHLGLTGLGESAALAEAIASGQFATVQTPYHLLNPSSGTDAPADFAEDDLGNLIAQCARQNMGVFAIRVLAGGALAGRAPSPHTLKTPFFPLELYQRDASRAEQLKELLPADMSLREAAVRFTISHEQITSDIVGFASPEEVSEVVDFAARCPLTTKLQSDLMAAAWRTGSRVREPTR
jgi:aryl-alcohol dehydrogenase-like predicted oxidoreductase